MHNILLLTGCQLVYVVLSAYSPMPLRSLLLRLHQPTLSTRPSVSHWSTLSSHHH